MDVPWREEERGGNRQTDRRSVSQSVDEREKEKTEINPQGEQPLYPGMMIWEFQSERNKVRLAFVVQPGTRMSNTNAYSAQIETGWLVGKRPSAFKKRKKKSRGLDP